MSLISASRCLPDRVDLLEVGDGVGLVLVGGLLLEQLAVADDGVEGRAQLVAHVGQEGALDPAGLDRLLVARASSSLTLRSSSSTRSRSPISCCKRVIGPGQLGLTLGDRPHLADAAEAGPDQEGVLDDHPARVLDPPPGLDRRDPVHRPGPVEPAQHVVQRHDRRGADQHPPVAVEGEQGQGREDVEVRLDPAPRQVDQQRPIEHLRDGDDVPRRRKPRPGDAQDDGQADDRPAEEEGRPDVYVDGAGVPDQARGDDGGRDQPRHPFEHQSAREEPVGLAKDVRAVAVEQRRCTRRHVGPVACAGRGSSSKEISGSAFEGEGQGPASRQRHRFASPRSLAAVRASSIGQKKPARIPAECIPIVHNETRSGAMARVRFEGPGFSQQKAQPTLLSQGVRKPGEQVKKLVTTLVFRLSMHDRGVDSLRLVSRSSPPPRQEHCADPQSGDSS